VITLLEPPVHCSLIISRNSCDPSGTSWTEGKGLVSVVGRVLFNISLVNTLVPTQVLAMAHSQNIRWKVLKWYVNTRFCDWVSSLALNTSLLTSSITLLSYQCIHRVLFIDAVLSEIQAESIVQGVSIIFLFSSTNSYTRVLWSNTVHLRKCIDIWRCLVWASNHLLHVLLFDS